MLKEVIGKIEVNVQVDNEVKMDVKTSIFNQFKALVTVTHQLLINQPLLHL